MRITSELLLMSRALHAAAQATAWTTDEPVVFHLLPQHVSPIYDQASVFGIPVLQCVIQVHQHCHTVIFFRVFELP
jgi:hypothetical protein